MVTPTLAPRATLRHSGMEYCMAAIVPPRMISASRPIARSTATRASSANFVRGLLAGVVGAEQIAAGAAGQESVVEGADHIDDEGSAEGYVDVEGFEQFVPAERGHHERQWEDEDREDDVAFHVRFLDHADQAALDAGVNDFLGVAALNILRRDPDAAPLEAGSSISS